MGLPRCPEEDAAARLMFLFLDIFMAKISRFNELQAVIAGKILIPGNLRTKYLECYTYGLFSSDRGCKMLIPDILRVKSSNCWTYGTSPPRSGLLRCGPDQAGKPVQNDADLILGASLIIRAVSSKSVDNRVRIGWRGRPIRRCPLAPPSGLPAAPSPGPHRIGEAANRPTGPTPA